MTNNKVKNAVADAIKALRGEDSSLDFGNIHERSTAHRLAVQLEPYFRGWNVDCEYDRDMQLKKELTGVAGCSPQKVTDKILPDIIVHHRQRAGRENNLLVIEIKRGTKEDACDRRKLELLTRASGRYAYQLGLYINLNEDRFDCTWYKNGALFKVAR